MKRRDIKKFRVHAGWTQAKTARMVGITRSHLANVENGHRPLHDDLKRKLTRVLKGAA
jgi:transcriptional regulator with XRE-family HTH domain